MPTTPDLPKRPAETRQQPENPRIDYLEDSQDFFESQLEDSQATYYSESQFDELDDSQATAVESSQAQPKREANPNRVSANIGRERTSR